MNQYRCETCKHRFTPDYWKDGCNRFGKTFMSDDEMRFISTYGCASHSDYQSERDKVLDAVFASMDTFFGNIPMDSHIIQWAISKQDSFVTAAMATYLESRKLRQAGEP